MFMITMFALLAQALPIETATLPLPPQLRDSATIVSMDQEMAVTTLREGDGPMVCIADRPGDDTFDARCYHRDFIPYLYRARELYRDGLSRDEAEAKLEAELADGSLVFALTPTAGYRMMGPISSLREDGSWGEEMRRWQSVHFPRATAEQLGLIVDRDGTMPFMMASGRLWSHVMINLPVE